MHCKVSYWIQEPNIHSQALSVQFVISSDSSLLYTLSIAILLRVFRD